MQDNTQAVHLITFYVKLRDLGLLSKLVMVLTNLNYYDSKVDVCYVWFTDVYQVYLIFVYFT